MVVVVVVVLVLVVVVVVMCGVILTSCWQGCHLRHTDSREKAVLAGQQRLLVLVGWDPQRTGTVGLWDCGTTT